MRPVGGPYLQYFSPHRGETLPIGFLPPATEPGIGTRSDAGSYEAQDHTCAPGRY